MFDLSALFKRAGKVAADNTSAILTAIGVTGTVAGVYLAAKGGIEAAGLLKEAEETKEADFLSKSLKDVAEGEEPEGVSFISPESLTFEEKFNATWKCFAPAVGCVVLSVTAMICANRVGNRRTAAMASAYSVVEKAYSEHRAKTVETVGKKKEQEIRDKIAQDRRDDHPIDKTTMVITGKGPTLCYDKWNDRYFNSSKNAIDAAVNEFNREVINNTYGSLTDFYHILNVPGTGHSDYIGWNTDKLLELEVSGTLDKEGQPCLQIDFRTNPIDRFDRAF